ncbi:MAG TPA: 3-deoxy-manno-octulosonate cytidylyltransferase [Caulobacteraceae bacterium]|jgi:3-deoxy-manno-octulosonate cytidylyltransferase (CMP-KDO synthetase)|nr:3-deoxy-manno-octulosonate cytidylyltransferase [Caulobacteraceae bacterium]
MNPIVIIPARMAARRLPGKPLADIGGEAMIVRVLRAAQDAGMGPVAVAAGDAAIAEAVAAAGGRAVLTDPDLLSGSDRVVAALADLDPEGAHDVVVNLQGDMPFIDPAHLRAAIELLGREGSCDIATLVAPEASPADRANPDVVKAIVALSPGATSGRTLYFTRGVLHGEGQVLRHIGLYVFRRHALNRFHAAPPSPLEQREGLEQLRALEMGLSIHAAIVPAAPVSVDTPADLAAARALIGRRP